MAILEGVQELTAALRALPSEVQQKVLRKSAISGAVVVRNAVQDAAPVSSGFRRRGGNLVLPGTLKRAVNLKFAPEKSNSDAATYVVSVRRGKSQQKSGRDAFYFLWVEKGHRVVGRSGRLIGHAPPHPFFVPAYRASAARARQRMKDTMEVEMKDVLQKQNYARIGARSGG